MQSNHIVYEESIPNFVYNGIVADCQSMKELYPGNDDKFCYQIKTRNGEDVLMLFDQQESMKKKIAATYLSQIQDAFQKQAGADLCIKAVFTEDVADHIIDYWKIGGASADAEEETADSPSPQNNNADPLDALCEDFPEIVELTDESDFVHYESETYSQTAFDEDEQEEFLEDQEKGENENG